MQQLRILANLRKLTPFVEQIMEAITNYIREEDDYFFKKGKLEGKQEGFLEGEEKGKLEGIEQNKRDTILKFLKDGILTSKQLASYFDVSEAFIENLRQKLQ